MRRGVSEALLAKTPVWLCTAGPTLIGPLLGGYGADAVVTPIQKHTCKPTHQDHTYPHLSDLS